MKTKKLKKGNRKGNKEKGKCKHRTRVRGKKESKGREQETLQEKMCKLSQIGMNMPDLRDSIGDGLAHMSQADTVDSVSFVGGCVPLYQSNPTSVRVRCANEMRDEYIPVCKQKNQGKRRERKRERGGEGKQRWREADIERQKQRERERKRKSE